MTDALADLLRACVVAGVPATAEDIVDAAWLARWMADTTAEPQAAVEDAPVEVKPERPESEPTPELPLEPLPPETDVLPQVDDEPPLELPSEPEPDSAGESVGVYLPSGANQSGAAGRVFRAPGAPALPRALEIARALRPLSRRVASRTRFVLDEAETIHRFVDERVCNPALRPAQERWLRLALVIDTGTGSDLWREVAREFRALLTCLGTFRDVRTWSLDTSANPPRLTPGTSAEGVARKPKELIDPAGRTLTVVLSPCIASGWHDGSAAAVLAEWAARGPVVLVQLLPEYLWPRTALAGATAVQITSPTAGIANRQLTLTRPDAWPGEEMPEGVPLPVAVLEPASLRRWAGLVAGHPGAESPGFVLDTEPAPSSTESPNLTPPTARVEQFRQTSSKLARRLAGLLAAAPVINLPIIRLIREAILPQAGQPQEAEVLFGGLLTRVPDSTASDPRFEFHPGVREALLDAVPTDESVPVLAAVSDYLGQHLASGRTFSAVLADPAAAAGELVADASPFARIAAEVLLRAGGDYARLVSRKGKKLAAAPGAAGTEPTAQPLAGGAESQEEAFPRPFGKYSLESKLGDGLSSVVYLARRSEQQFALKMPRAGAGCTPEERAAIQKESEILARLAELQSPNICHIFDTGEIDGCPFFTMTHIPGETLGSYWAREGSRLGPWGAADLVHSFAIVLARIHALTLDSKRILHRNLTPQNILVLLTDSTPPLVERFVFIDFGPDPNCAEVGYAPPEELVPGWRGYSVTLRSDIYSLGAVLYWMLTGLPPFAGSSEELVAAVLNNALHPPSAINPALAPFNEICSRALARHPDDRYQSMRAFADTIIATYREHGKPESMEATAEIDPQPPSSVEARELLLDAADELAEVEQLRDIARELRSHARDPEATEADFQPDDKTEADEWPAGVAHAELEAITAIQTDPLRYPAQPKWRRSLPLNRPVRLGRDAEFADWDVPNDSLISRLHAVLEWDGLVLTVTRRSTQPPNFPNPPTNHIWFHNKPVEQCTVKPGEWFLIGHTRFSLHSELVEVEVATDVTAQVADAAAAGSRVDPNAALRAIERLQRVIQQPSNESRSIWQALLAAVMDALPRTDTASVIYLPQDGEAGRSRTRVDQITMVESTTRPSTSRQQRAPRLVGNLVHKAIRESRRSELYVSRFEYLYDDFRDPEADWAICTPFLDGSRYALYLAGEVNREWNLPADSSAEKRVEEDLAQYQRMTELLITLTESAWRRGRLEEQQQAMRNALPQALRKSAENPDELERLLTPRELEITTLFCNLQDYSRYASRHLDNLLQAQREVAGALNTRAMVITERGGLVAGQHGEAILGFWGWPNPLADQMEAAARAAMLMQSQTSPGLLAGRLGLGLTHGVAVAGRLTSHDAAVVDVFGPVVDLAPQLGELAQTFGVGIVMNEAAAALLQAADPYGDRWRVRRLGRVRLPGFLAQNIYELNWSLGGATVTSERYRELLTLWHEALEFFTGGNWRQAREALEADFVADAAAHHLIRVMNRTDSQPPDDWDGTFTP